MPEIDEFEKQARELLVRLGHKTQPIEYVMKIAQALREVHDRGRQEMYDMVGCVYHSSKSEVACLVKDECYLTNTIFNGNENTNHEVTKLTNDQIINEWLKLFKI